MAGRQEDRTVVALERMADASERMAVANEQLIKLATEERDSGDSILGPPFCPHCNTFDPKLRQIGTGTGQMSEFILEAACDNCGNRVYGVPQGWLVFHTGEQALTYIEGREGK